MFNLLPRQFQQGTVYQKTSSIAEKGILYALCVFWKFNLLTSVCRLATTIWETLTHFASNFIVSTKTSQLGFQHPIVVHWGQRVNWNCWNTFWEFSEWIETLFYAKDPRPVRTKLKESWDCYWKVEAWYENPLGCPIFSSLLTIVSPICQ